jgi:hypothetical protein
MEVEEDERSLLQQQLTLAKDDLPRPCRHGPHCQPTRYTALTDRLG